MGQSLAGLSMVLSSIIQKIIIVTRASKCAFLQHSCLSVYSLATSSSLYTLSCFVCYLAFTSWDPTENNNKVTISLTVKSLNNNRLSQHSWRNYKKFNTTLTNSSMIPPVLFASVSIKLPTWLPSSVATLSITSILSASSSGSNREKLSVPSAVRK